jgi:dynein assembly factor 2
MEQAGDLPAGTKLIRPDPLFCIKTSGKKMVSDTDKIFFDQKHFINICIHKEVAAPEKVPVTQNGKTGYTWNLPYRVSKLRHDQDSKGNLCSTFDVVFHPEVE